MIGKKSVLRIDPLPTQPWSEGAAFSPPLLVFRFYLVVSFWNKLWVSVVNCNWCSRGRGIFPISSLSVQNLVCDNNRILEETKKLNKFVSFMIYLFVFAHVASN